MEIDKSNPAYKKAIVKNTILTASITIGAILLVGGTYLLVKKLKSIPKDSKPEATPQPAPVQTQAPQQMDATKMTESNYKPQVPVPQPEA